jgi:hypothetical protein
MPTMQLTAHTRSAELSAVVTRKNGDIEEYGVVAFAHRSRLRHLVGNARLQFFGLIGYVRVRVTRPGQAPRFEWRRIPKR